MQTTETSHHVVPLNLKSQAKYFTLADTKASRTNEHCMWPLIRMTKKLYRSAQITGPIERYCIQSQQTLHPQTLVGLCMQHAYEQITTNTRMQHLPTKNIMPASRKTILLHNLRN